MGPLKFSLKAIEDAQWSDKEDPLYVLLDGELEYEHFSAVESAPNLHLRLKLRVHFTRGYNWVALEDVHGDALISAKECTKRFNKRWT